MGHPTIFPQDSQSQHTNRFPHIDKERTHFNYLLNWAQAVYTARISYYNDHWTYAQAHHSATPWLDHDTTWDPDRLPKFTEPNFLLSVDWATWIAWTEHCRPHTCRCHTLTAHRTFDHNFQPFLEPTLPLPPPCLSELFPDPYPWLAFTATYSLFHLPIYSWLTCHCDLVNKTPASSILFSHHPQLQPYHNHIWNFSYHLILLQPC